MPAVLIDLDGSMSGTPDKVMSWHPSIVPDGVTFFIAPIDYTFDKYNYIPQVSGVYDPNGFVQKQVLDEVNFALRQLNVNSMSSYMVSFVIAGALTQNSFDLFLADTAALIQGYLGGGGRLLTWIETVNRNGYNASTTGFKTRTAYRGSLVNGVYPRAEAILAILNNL